MRLLFRLSAIVLGVLGLMPSAMLAFVCTTRTGLVFALGGMLLSGAPIMVCSPWRARWKAALSMVLGWAAVTVWLALESPSGQAPPAAAVQHRYVGGQGAFQRYALGNLLPEQDQFALGFRLIPAVDPLFTQRQAGHLSALVKDIYNELEADPAFHAMGSVMPEAYDELWGLPFEHGHYWLYVPPGLDRTKPHPALVFLHGSGGSFKAYTWLLAKVAEQRHMILIAPSYGMGNWTEESTTRTIHRALDDAAKVVAIDKGRVHLAGLSNGGLGVSYAAMAMGGEFRSLVFFSPVFNNPVLASEAFASQWRGRPVLVISGTEDDRIPFDYVTRCVDTMREQGAEVILKPVEGANHFMFFSHRERVLKVLEEWLGAFKEKALDPQ